MFETRRRKFRWTQTPFEWRTRSCIRETQRLTRVSDPDREEEGEEAVTQKTEDHFILDRILFFSCLPGGRWWEYQKLPCLSSSSVHSTNYSFFTMSVLYDVSPLVILEVLCTYWSPCFASSFHSQLLISSSSSSNPFRIQRHVSRTIISASFIQSLLRQKLEGFMNWKT